MYIKQLAYNNKVKVLAQVRAMSMLYNETNK